MARFNIVEKNNIREKTYEGALAYKRSTADAWFNFLFSSFLEDQYYETSKEQINRFIELTDKMAQDLGYKFVGKAAIFARNELGMRSISQLIAAWLNDKPFDCKRNFYKVFMHRPDDVSEIFAALGFLDQKKSHAFIKGAADYLSTLNEYQIMKYKMIGHQYNMYDVINLTHAKSDVINAFMKGQLEAPDTWENKIVNAGSKERRQEEWIRLVEQHKLGYMALIKNLNNIVSSNVTNYWIKTILVPQIKNEKAIKKSLIFPYRLYTAYKNLNVDNFYIKEALEEAFQISTQNVPDFGDGVSAIVLDVSGSMESRVSKNSNITLKEIGACFAMSLFYKNSNIDFIKFGTQAKRITINPLNSVFTNILKLSANDNLGYGTELNSAFTIMNDNYARIFLISDMQIFDNPGWWYTSNNIIKQWRQTYKDINTYSFDLGNYKSQIMSPYDNIVYLTSLSDKIFKFIGMSEGDSIESIINNYIDF